jgi:hypothetical protein
MRKSRNMANHRRAPPYRVTVLAWLAALWPLLGITDVATAAEPPLPPGQVWQCTIDGQKTFSDKRCGAAASVRRLNEVNRMDPTPESNIHFYGGRAPAHSPDFDTASAGEDGAAPVGADEIYGSPPVIVVHRRPGHRPAPRAHPHGQGHK